MTPPIRNATWAVARVQPSRRPYITSSTRDPRSARSTARAPPHPACRARGGVHWGSGWLGGRRVPATQLVGLGSLLPDPAVGVAEAGQRAQRPSSESFMVGPSTISADSVRQRRECPARDRSGSRPTLSAAPAPRVSQVARSGSRLYSGSRTKIFNSRFVRARYASKPR